MISSNSSKAIVLRDANPDDCPLIAWAFLAALGLDETHLPPVIDICRREDTIYSWKRTRIAMVDHQPAGCLISYTGDDYDQLRESTWHLFDDFWTKTEESFEPETYPDEYYLDTLAVLPSFRKMGVARELLLDGVKKGRKLGYSKVTLIAEADDAHLLAYYKKVGFNELNAIRFFGHSYMRMQFGKVKGKAPNNRTLTIHTDEIESLASRITHKNELSERDITNKIIHADLMEVLDLIPDQSANLIIIDPPYNLSKDFNGKKFSAMNSEKYEDYLRSWFFKVCDKLTEDGTLYMCGDWKCTSSLQRVIEERLTILNRITWQREKGRGASRNWKNGMEDIWFAVKDPKNYYFNVDAVKQKRKVIAPYRVDGAPKDWEATEAGKFRTTYPSNFWDDISIPFWSMPENTDHPTQKPEKLYAKLILASSKPGDLVFDPFLGSGTTAVTAHKLGRHFCGIEINEEYCLWAAKRLAMAEENPTIQGYTDGVFWERNTLNKQK